ncbi:MAG: DUF4105 domain-containing protein [Pseudomonadota bacterium]
MSAGRIMLYGLYAALAAAALFAGYVLMKKPRGDREWSPPLSRVAVFEESAPFQYTLKNIRAWEYGPDGAMRKEWEDQPVDAERLKEVWFFVEPFAGNPLFAHSFLSFVFEEEDGSRRTLSVSIEARKEAGEAYSALRGAFRAYELLYVWSTEKDVLSRIAVKLDHTLYAYRLDLEADRAIMIFDHFVKRTNELAERPRFYNTLHSNCTNELAKGVNDAFPGALPWHRSWVMTGRSAKWLHKLGFIGPSSTSFKAITSQSDIQGLVKEHIQKPAEEFDDSWRQSFFAGRADLLN